MMEYRLLKFICLKNSVSPSPGKLRLSQDD